MSDKANVGIEDLTFEISWTSKVKNIDIDIAAFMLSNGNTLENEKNAIYFNNMKAKGCYLEEDACSLANQKSFERMHISLSLIPESIKKIILCTAIYQKEGGVLRFGDLNESSMKLSSKTREILSSNNLGKSDCSASFLALLTKNKNGSWIASTIDKSFIGDLNVAIQKLQELSYAS